MPVSNFRFWIQCQSLNIYFVLVEGKGHGWTWSQSQSKDCGGCVNDDNCQESICVAIPNQKKAFAFENVCKALGKFGQQRNVVTVYLALGHCRHIFGENGNIMIRFHIDFWHLNCLIQLN